MHEMRPMEQEGADQSLPVGASAGRTETTCGGPHRGINLGKIDPVERVELARPQARIGEVGIDCPIDIGVHQVAAQKEVQDPRRRGLPGGWERLAGRERLEHGCPIPV
jgi:hypothetical protein